MIYLGADHGGLEIKTKIVQWLTQEGIAYEDLGATTLDPHDDYPDFAQAVAQNVAKDPENRGILLCRSGAGMAIAANRFSKIRAVEISDARRAEHSRAHNDANIAVIAADWIDQSTVLPLIQTFLHTPFSGEERHKRRNDKIDAL